MKFTWSGPCLATPGFPPMVSVRIQAPNPRFLWLFATLCHSRLHRLELSNHSAIVTRDELFGRWVSELLFHCIDPTPRQKQLKGEEASISLHFPHGREDRAAGREVRRGRAGSVQCFCKVIKRIVTASPLRVISLVSNFPHGFWYPVRSWCRHRFSPVNPTSPPLLPLSSTAVSMTFSVL